METTLENTNPIEGKKGYNAQELFRFKYPDVELKNRKLTINETSVEGLPEVDGFYITPDASNIVAYIEKDKERKLFILGRNSADDASKFSITTQHDDTSFDKYLTTRTKHVFGKKAPPGAEKSSDLIPVFDGVDQDKLQGI